MDSSSTHKQSEGERPDSSPSVPPPSLPVRPPNTSVETWKGLNLPGLPSPNYSNGDIAIVRSFSSEIKNRIIRLGSKFDVSSLGDVSYGKSRYPIYRVTAGSSVGSAKATVFLSALSNGDEPAGAMAVLEFLEKHAERYLGRYRFVAYPCLNPSGFEANTMETLDGGSCNRSFGRKNAPQEVKLLQKDLFSMKQRFLFAMDFHEAPPYFCGEGVSQEDNPREPWLYETCADPRRCMGEDLLLTLPPDINVCESDEIYGDKAVGGLIRYASQMTAEEAAAPPSNLEGFLLAKNFTAHTFVPQTPTGQSLEKRLRFHLHCLRTSLDVYGVRASV